MGTRNGAIDRAERQIRDDLRRIRADVGRARRAAGLSQDAVAGACRMSVSAVARLERGETEGTSLVHLACVAAAVGLELRLRAFLAGEPIRDAGQQRLVGRLRARLAPELQVRTEVGLAIDGDRRAWDLTVAAPTWTAFVEAETVIDDVQALERRIALKKRDGRAEIVVLLVADTRRNRGAVAGAHAAGSLAWLPIRTRQVLRALGAPPSAPTSAPVSGTVFL